MYGLKVKGLVLVFGEVKREKWYYVGYLSKRTKTDSLNGLLLRAFLKKGVMFMDYENAILEEYRSLREELMKTQSHRQVILGFTVTGVGAVIKTTLGHSPASIEGLNNYALGLISFAMVLIIAALLLTRHHTQQIDVIGGYIRRFIEARAEGLCWESRWMRYRESMSSSGRGSALPLGTSKPLALFYALLTIGTFSLSFVTGLYRSFPAICWLVGLLLFSLSVSTDLYLRRRKSWKTNWEIIE